VTASHPYGVLVVGAGQAAVQLASSLREGGYDETIALVGREPHLPYQRPPLSKGYLKGAVTQEALAFRAPSLYREHGIELILGKRIEGVDIRADGSGVAGCERGERLGFERLVLATGARARGLAFECGDAAGVHRLRDLDHAQALREDLAKARDVVVLGGGFVGLEAAATARLMGKVVTVVEAGPSLLGRAVGPATSAHMQAAHEKAGVRVLLGSTAVRLLVHEGRVTGVEVSDGTTLSAQVVLVGIGATPRTQLAERAALLCRDGIVVDEQARTSDGVTLAVGDCASVPDPSPDGDPSVRVRLESVDSAVEQARTAAATLLGQPSPYRGVPWFWSDQGELKLQVAGLRRAGDTCVVRRYADPRKLTVCYYRDGRMVAADAVNRPGDAIAVRRALEARDSFDPDKVADPALALKDLLRRPAGAATR
jgi:3-phenylpropionate/trans-cinnamate dioxygenase ferredoxin reductase subunit